MIENTVLTSISRAPVSKQIIPIWYSNEENRQKAQGYLDYVSCRLSPKEIKGNTFIPYTCDKEDKWEVALGIIKAWPDKEHHPINVEFSTIWDFGRIGNAFIISINIPLPKLEEYIGGLFRYALNNPHLTFNIPEIESAPIQNMFKDAPANCILPDGWRQ